MLIQSFIKKLIIFLKTSVKYRKKRFLIYQLVSMPNYVLVLGLLAVIMQRAAKSFTLYFLIGDHQDFPNQ